MDTVTKINEIFSSIQGEGPVVGYKQLFIRFCLCNLNCDYCDTEFLYGENYTSQALYEKINNEFDLKTFHSISLTGGEPLLSYRFLKEFLPLIKSQTKIYLETNATLVNEFEKVKNLIDIVAADIKLPSCYAGISLFGNHERFIKSCSGIETFAKIVFDKNINQEEIDFCTSIGEKYNIELILQPKMEGDKITVTPEFCEQILNLFTNKHSKTRLIPQVHKFLNVQ